MAALAMFFIKEWKLGIVGLLLIALGVQTLRLSWCQNEQAQAVIAAQKKQIEADKLASQLVIAQAQALAVNAEKTTTFIDRIVHVPTQAISCATDPRMRLGSAGVRSIILGSSPPSGVTNPVPQPSPRP